MRKPNCSSGYGEPVRSNSGRNVIHASRQSPAETFSISEGPLFQNHGMATPAAHGGQAGTLKSVCTTTRTNIGSLSNSVFFSASLITTRQLTHERNWFWECGSSFSSGFCLPPDLFISTRVGIARKHRRCGKYVDAL